MKKITLLILSISVLFCLVACNNQKPQEPTPEQHTHSFGEWSITKNATCTEDGVKIRYCGCGEKQNEVISASGHKEEILFAKEATCTETGLTWGKMCSVCKYILINQEIIPAFGHDWKEATCTEPKTCQCAYCGATEGEANGHTFGECVVVKEATTGEEGLKMLFCICGKIKTETIPMITSEGLKYSFNEDGESYTVTGIGTCLDTVVNIPRFLSDGFPVTSIGESAFYGCKSFNSIIIPDSVTTIGDSAFGSCTSLGSIEIPNSVTTIGVYAFGGCTSLSSIEIPNSVTTIGGYAFGGCTSLSSIEIPNSVTTIGGSAFRDCTSLSSIEIPNSVTTIGDYAFSGCTSLSSIEIPNSVTTIGDYAFCRCYGLTSVVIGDGVITIGDGVFYSCNSLAFVEIGDSVTTIGGSAFRDCTSLSSIEIPNSVTTIGGYTFDGCISLTIYCEATSKPSGWNSHWNSSDRPVVWGYTS